MIREFRAVREIATVIAIAADTAIEAYRRQRVEDEPHITDRMMGAIERSVNGLSALSTSLIEGDQKAVAKVPSPYSAQIVGDDQGFDVLAFPPPRRDLVWEAKTLRAGSGRAAEEKLYGADILGVLKIDLPEYKVAKGFLAQAKRAEPGVDFSRREWDRLVAQCEAMLKVSPCSFVLVYSKARGARFFSANAVKAFSGRDLFQLYDLGVRRFFEMHIESFIGDVRLDEPHLSVLERVRSLAPAGEPSAHVLELLASESPT